MGRWDRGGILFVVEGYFGNCNTQCRPIGYKKKLIKKILWFWDVFWCERKVMFFHG